MFTPILLLLIAPVVLGVILSRLLAPILLLVGIGAANALPLIATSLIQLFVGMQSGDISLKRLLVTGAYYVAGVVWLGGVGHSLGTVLYHWRTLGPKTLAPLAPYAMTGLVVRGIWQIPARMSTRSDAILLENFRQHEREFQQLAAMYEEDQRPFAICPPGKHRPTLTSERLAGYDTLMAATGVRHGITREPHGEVFFRFWAQPMSGWFDQSLEKGYAWLDRPPERVVASLDNERRLGQGLTYRRVAGPWYLYYYNRDSLSATCDFGS